MTNKAKAWALIHGFEDGIFWKNEEGQHIADVLTRATILTDDLEFVQVTVTDGFEREPLVGYAFDDDSVLVLLGDVWTTFDSEWQSEDTDMTIEEMIDV